MNRTFWLFILALCVAGTADHARANVTLLGGVSVFQKPSDGLYWNHNQQNSFDLNPLAAGIRWDSKRSGNWSVGVQYTHFGEMRVNALAVSQDAPEAGGYVPNEGTCTGPCAELARWKMTTETQSVAFILTRHVGNWSFDVGANVYETHTKGHVVFENSGSWIWPYKEGRWLDVSPMAGVTYQHGPWSARFQYWRMEGRGSPTDPYIPPAAYCEDHQMTAMVGYTF